MDSATADTESELVTDLTSTHTAFLDTVRYGGDDNAAWDEFYTILLQQISDSGLVEPAWINTIISRWVPTLRYELKRDVLAGYEDGPLFVLFMRRIREFVIAIQRWARWNNAQSEADYHYIATAYLAIDRVYRRTWLPAWAHEKLLYLLIHSREKIEMIGDETQISKFLLELGPCMKSFTKEVRKGKCTKKKWRKQLQVLVKFVKLTHEVEQEIKADKVNIKNTRDKITDIIKFERDDRKAFEQVVQCVVEILQNFNSDS